MWIGSEYAMNWPEKVTRALESKEAKGVALASGVAAALTKIIQPALPSLAQPVATVFLVVVGMYVLWFVGRVAVEWETNVSEAEAAHRYLSRNYGFAYAVVEVECTIRDDGSADVRRVAEVEAYSQVGNIDTFLFIPEEAPSGEERDVEIVCVKPLTPGRTISWEFLKGARSLAAKLTIAPRLNPGETFRYVIEERLPAGLYAIDLCPEELAKRKTPYEYFGWDIKRPTRYLSMKVYFPEGIKPDGYDNEVRYASAAPDILDASRVFYEGQGRLEKPELGGPEGGRHPLQQNVEYPIVGLLYLLRWEPLQSG